MSYQGIDYTFRNTFNNLMIYVNQEYEKYQSLENKGEYKAPRRSVIVFHEASSVIKMLSKTFEQFAVAVDEWNYFG